MSNPIFDRIDKDVSRGGYAGFGNRGPASPSSFGQFGSQPQYGQMTPDDLQTLYDTPAASPAASHKLTVDDVVMKSLLLFGILLSVGAAAFFLLPVKLSGVAMLGSIVVTLVLGIIIAMKQNVSVPLIIAYAAFEGLLVGVVTRTFAFAYSGVVSTAIVATLAVFAAMFIGWKTGFVKVTDRTRRIFGMAILGYMIFGVINLIAAWAFKANGGAGLLTFGSPIAIGVSLIAVGLAAYSLAMDFDSIDRAVAAQVPQKYSWLLAHGLMVTVIWLYLELLRLIAQLQSRD
ncbi:Bax inhibitor-1/YccA family protein [Dermatophilus congolensis]|uniref:Bax inhibitor-1/YccA family protein n=1 Tax=Dermatophilus congolensis TaxID=1863 RepID=UPI001AAEC66D|nr:Bax inhibitor-1/YccA family protein [Dermatophilus congolensis]MBO3143270.1 Bax inhibitor-1/YccA family protein [Dermatophilus congolensis]MBO3152257.1 Bax inhibitor-1/YccA family protein [Dermatophilus congolensis]MBO3160731.1 Bax inhibitor-1/YccA family protein [Dermatophilus congolensis]MBO3163545.1 Bax inhibitor-1/YccA family protein [Dermatophilus congolensis]MBO3177091.1 Bax inhibitor-1/YccA family protein [Dermatophilus congolensis]